MLVRTINFYYRQDVYAETNLQLTFYYTRVKINTFLLSTSPIFSSHLFSLLAVVVCIYISIQVAGLVAGLTTRHQKRRAPDPPPKRAGHNSLNRYILAVINSWSLLIYSMISDHCMIYDHWSLA